MKRHRDAVAISDGACNPIAIVNAMKAAIEEIRASGVGDTDTILQDPALRLMTYQLAYLQDLPLSGTPEWIRWYEACEEACREKK